MQCQKTVAWLLRYIQKLKNAVSKTKQYQLLGKQKGKMTLVSTEKEHLNQFFLSRDEMYEAKIRLFRYCQETHFSLEISVLQSNKQLDLESPL